VPDGNARAPAPGSAQAAKNAAHSMTFPKTKLSQAVEINVSADGGLTIGIDKTGAASRFLNAIADSMGLRLPPDTIGQVQ